MSADKLFGANFKRSGMLAPTLGLLETTVLEYNSKLGASVDLQILPTENLSPFELFTALYDCVYDNVKQMSCTNSKSLQPLQLTNSSEATIMKDLFTPLDKTHQ